ncbi:class I SAM-dependent methyltransferase [Salinirubellus salinus]|uniref:Class I SAM-dependent methyltransferase n=1 Tax=Salinirubellus salinus TaxID=1364945 RepID=A0A9E7U859_9EURY|nr:class I SAM-dependent methyltransferase [Salinirubellus salinus]UWM54361.1 class I SAM-dependent methyltransferase [Salinirubellus salinus]
MLDRALKIAREDGILQLLRSTERVVRARLLYELQKHEMTRQLYESAFAYTDYWESRYAAGRPSGPGSVGAHARFKADVVNELVAENDVESVLEFGCGDGSQLELAEYPEYIGLEVSESAVQQCAERFADDPRKSFFLYRPSSFVNRGPFDSDVVVSLEVLFHVVDRETWEKTLSDMFNAARRYVVVFSSNRDDPATDKMHIRHRRFTEHVEREFPEFELIEVVENPFEERHSDFYIYERTAPEE